MAVLSEWPSGFQTEPRAPHVLKRTLLLAPLVVAGHHGAVRDLDDARVADVLVDARVLRIDAAPLLQPGLGRHPAGPGDLGRAPRRHAALADHELVRDRPADPVL